MHLTDFIVAGQFAFAGITAGLGFVVLAPPIPNHRAARVLFWLGALSFGSMGIVWALTSEDYSLRTQMLVAAICAAIAAAGLVWGLRQVNVQLNTPERSGSPSVAPSTAGDNNSGNSGIITKDQKGNNVIKR
jgi:hypothetical protein